MEEFRLKLLQNPDGLEPAALRTWLKDQALAFIDRMLRFLSWDIAACEEHEQNLEEASLAVAVLPSSEVLDKIIRYETRLEWQLYRAMNQLERLQRLRLGESVPLPLFLEVSEKACTALLFLPNEPIFKTG